MAVLIDITLTAETDEYADYAFARPEGAGGGALRIRKSDGVAVLLIPIQSVDPDADFARAAHKLRKYWLAGPLPDRTVWAS